MGTTLQDLMLSNVLDAISLNILKQIPHIDGS